MARQKLTWCDVLRLSILANLLPDSHKLSDPVIFLRQIQGAFFKKSWKVVGTRIECPAKLRERTPRMD